MLGAVVRLLFFALIVNPNFLAILKRRRGRVARSATPERSGGSLAEAKKSPKKFAEWGSGSCLLLFSPFFRDFITQCCVQSLAVVIANPYLEPFFYCLQGDIIVQIEQLVFVGAPKTLHSDVISPTSLTIHARLNT